MTFLKILKVTGRSLEHEFQEGDFVIISEIPFLLHPPRVGDFVVFNKPPYGILIKAVSQVKKSRRELSVRGTFSGSVDSRIFGSLPFDSVQGKVIRHIRRKKVIQ